MFIPHIPEYFPSRLGAAIALGARRIVVRRWKGTGMARLLSRAAAVAFVSWLGAGAPVHAQSYTWTGLYAGATVGGGWAHLNSNTTATCPPGGYFCNPANPTNSFGISNAVSSTSGQLSTLNGSSEWSTFTGSGALGFNYQFRDWVFGIEGDGGYLHLHGTKSFSAKYLAANPPVGAAKADTFTVSQSFDSDWLVTLRGRLAYAVIPAMLVYAHGGLAVTNFNVQNSFSDYLGAAEAATANNRFGWTAGAGAEVALTRNWALKAEYLYVDMGTANATGVVVNPAFPGATNGLTTSSVLTTHIMRAGIDYRF